MPGHGEKLSRTQERAIAALLEQPTIEAAAKVCGVNEKTLRRWLKAEAFSEAFKAARERVVDFAVVSLQRSMHEAVDALVRNLTAASPTVQVQAARAILEQCMPSRLIINDERVKELQKKIKSHEDDLENLA